MMSACASCKSAQTWHVQEDLVTEDRYYHEELERQRDIKLKALYQEHSSKAHQNQQAQESIKSQVQF